MPKPGGSSGLLLQSAVVTADAGSLQAYQQTLYISVNPNPEFVKSLTAHRASNGIYLL
jgi:hypothetical protein